MKMAPPSPTQPLVNSVSLNDYIQSVEFPSAFLRSFFAGLKYSVLMINDDAWTACGTLPNLSTLPVTVFEIGQQITKK